jgi:predicted sulfurtransferase
VSGFTAGAEHKRRSTMEIKVCPTCGHPFSAVDIVLSEHDAGFQCHHCWNRMQATGPANRTFNTAKKPRIFTAQKSAMKHERRK